MHCILFKMGIYLDHHVHVHILALRGSAVLVADIAAASNQVNTLQGNTCIQINYHSNKYHISIKWKRCDNVPRADDFTNQLTIAQRGNNRVAASRIGGLYA